MTLKIYPKYLCKNVNCQLNYNNILDGYNKLGMVFYMKNNCNGQQIKWTT